MKIQIVEPEVKIRLIRKVSSNDAKVTILNPHTLEMEIPEVKENIIIEAEDEKGRTVTIIYPVEIDLSPR